MFYYEGVGRVWQVLLWFVYKVFALRGKAVTVRGFRHFLDKSRKHLDRFKAKRDWHECKSLFLISRGEIKKLFP